MILFGGVWGPGGEQNDVWALSFSPEPSWTRLEPRGTAPVLDAPSAVLDLRRKRMLLYGGRPDGTGELWELTLSEAPAWAKLWVGQRRLPYRAGHSAVFDPGYDRMIAFGGEESRAVVVTFGPSPSWSYFGTEPQPGLRTGNTTVWDSFRGLMWISGGHALIGPDGYGGRFVEVDTWSLDLRSRTWTRMGDTEPLPGRSGRPCRSIGSEHEEDAGVRWRDPGA